MDAFLAFFALFDVRTLMVMAAGLYVSLTLIMLYTYRYRQTYPGFGFFTLGQALWSVGILALQYRFLGEKFSLVSANLLLLLQPASWYQGLALYGGVGNIRKRVWPNYAVVLAGAGFLAHYVYVDFDTCKRILIFSGCSAILYLRMALEPYVVKKWKTYSMQSLFATITAIVGIAYTLRILWTWDRLHCLVGGPDPITKSLLILSMLLFPLMTFSLLSMTSGRIESELLETRDALRHQAQTDALTGLTNRRHFLYLAQTAVEQAQTHEEPLSLLMLDLDHFKDINDTHGHQTGDNVLRAVGRCLGMVLRSQDTVGRLGGEEFGVLLPGLDAKAAVGVAHRLRRAVAGLRPEGLPVTVSLGVATGTDDVDALLGRADECLYAAKRAGRNRVSLRESRACQAVVVEEVAS